jgi:gamma-glutamylcyclotransferase (GGCT)/AIG2-like uncharacterized protein YtfP
MYISWTLCSYARSTEGSDQLIFYSLTKDNINRLIVYGSLAPGESNEHVLQPLKGTWSSGFIKGYKEILTTGEAIGYYAFTPDDNGPDIEVLIFESDELFGYWDVLDEFEGDDYKRILIEYEDPKGKKQMGHIYRISC